MASHPYILVLEQFILVPHVKGYRVFIENFSFFFNSYYNNAGERVLREQRGNMSRPSVEKVCAYRKYVDHALLKMLDQQPSSEVLFLVTLGLNHEQQHQELGTDIKYMLSQNPLFPSYDTTTSLLDHEKNKSSGSITTDEGVYEIGYKGSGFCYDNELGLHKVYIHDCEIENRLVTNGEYLEFLDAGAYSDFNLWLDEGWTWKFYAGERINTEISRKYNDSILNKICGGTGLQVIKKFTDSNEYIADYILEKS